MNAYELAAPVAKVIWRPRPDLPRIEVSASYAAGTPLARRSEGAITFAASSDGVANYCRALPAICRTVREKKKSPEGKWESDVVRTNEANTPFVVLDRQLSSGGAQKRLDLLVVNRDSEDPYLAAVEIKRGLDDQLEAAPGHVGRYLSLLDPSGKGLRADAAAAYRKICVQRGALGLAAPSPSLIRRGMRVEGLVALARSNNHASGLLARARRAAGAMERAIWFCTIEDANPRIPLRSDWFR